MSIVVIIKVELSLGMGIFTGACMVAGTLVGGFRSMLDVYILDALADKDHGYVSYQMGIFNRYVKRGIKLTSCAWLCCTLAGILVHPVHGRPRWHD